MSGSPGFNFGDNMEGAVKLAKHSVQVNVSCKENTKTSSKITRNIKVCFTSMLYGVGGSGVNPEMETEMTEIQNKQNPDKEPQWEERCNI